jgi:hypothetical protein
MVWLLLKQARLSDDMANNLFPDLKQGREGTKLKGRYIVHPLYSYLQYTTYRRPATMASLLNSFKQKVEEVQHEVDSESHQVCSKGRVWEHSQADGSIDAQAVCW